MASMQNLSVDNSHVDAIIDFVGRDHPKRRIYVLYWDDDSRPTYIQAYRETLVIVQAFISGRESNFTYAG